MFSSRTNWPANSNRFTRELESERRAGRVLLDLTVSNPTTAGFEYDEQRIREALSRPEVLTYEPEPQGLVSARDAIAAYYAEREPSATVDPTHVFVFSGTSEAYAHIFRLLCEAGDEVLIASPGYPLLDLIADICDLRLVKFHLFYDHGWHMDIHDLESKISSRTRAIVVVHPNNPTGSYIKPGEREQLDRICREKGLALIVDEVFLDYTIEAKDAVSFADNGGVLTFTLSGLSKIAGLPQMKAAWSVISGPGEKRSEAKRRLELISDTFLSAGTPVQVALRALLETRRLFQRQLGSRIQANLAEIDRQLKQQHACARLVVEGGWYAILRVPSLRLDEELAIDLMKQEGIVVEPGHFFDLPSDGLLVLSLMTPEQEFQQGIQRILARF